MGLNLAKIRQREKRVRKLKRIENRRWWKKIGVLEKAEEIKIELEALFGKWKGKEKKHIKYQTLKCRQNLLHIKKHVTILEDRLNTINNINQKKHD